MNPVRNSISQPILEKFPPKISNGVKILAIGSDRKLFDENSEVRRRIIEYGRFADELHIIIFSNKKLKIENCPPAWTSPGRSQAGKLKISANVYLYPTNSKSRWFYIYDAIKIGKKILASGGQWLISGQDPFECGLVGWLIKRKPNIPLQLQIHVDFLSPYFWEESILNKIRVLIAKFLIPRANCIRVVSKRIKRSLLGELAVGEREKARSRIIVLPIFVDVEKIQKTPIKTDLHKKYPQFDFIILTASRLTQEKNIGLAIEAMTEVVKKYPKAGLIIVGDGPEKENYSLLVTQLLNNIIIEPRTDDLASYCKTADLFLLTSNYEGYGMAVVEAMAAGCPVIMTDVGLAHEVLVDKKDGLIIPVGAKEKLREAILNLMKNSGLRNDLIRNSQKTLSFWPKREDYLKAYRDSWLSCNM